MDVDSLAIEKLVHRGFGLGRHESRVWLVPFTLPGDVVTAGMVRDRGGHVEGEVRKVLEEGPGRTTPPCPWYGRCGGCHLQHADYDTQVRLKIDVLQETLKRTGGVQAPDPEIVTGEPWAWRSRAQFHVSGTTLGFYARGSRRIVEVEECPLVVPGLSALIPVVRKALGDFRFQGTWDLELVDGGSKGVVAVARGDGRKIRNLADGLVGLSGIEGSLAGIRAKRGYRWTQRGLTAVSRTTVDGRGKPASLESNARCFSQANGSLNLIFARTVMDFAGPVEGRRVLELYAGAGNLTYPLALSGADVMAVETDTRSIAAAAQAVRKNRNLKVRTVAGRSEDAVARAVESGQQYDLVVADPPRAGMKRLLKDLVRLGPRRLVLCSCEPSSLARDLAQLTLAGYRIDRLALVDMFPQTYHMETVVSLRSPRS
ncbi:MAG: class I SAM-dependent RNA methyltransferase [Deltaproteobacteria bacterium]|nr:class I SAM-dependent RNA methyltransferase [Deltaproteobacteria bacterium]